MTVCCGSLLARTGLRAAAMLLVVSPLAAGAADMRPVLDLDFPDPFVMPVPDGLIAYATNTRRGGERLNVQMSRSSDGVHWSTPVDAMPVAPRWARTGEPDIWAPEVLRIGETYVLYFSARNATLTRPDGLTLCVGAAVADRPEGPFRAMPAPLTCGGPEGVIDASPFADGADLWLYVKTDGNCCHARVRFLAQRLSPDGLHLRGHATSIAGLASDHAWEGNVIEAPEMRRHEGQLQMFFSANNFADARYAVGFARCASPSGPCEQAPENPILASRAELVGPGHACVFDWRGQSWMAFAAWREAAPRYRAMYIALITWEGDVPRVGTAEAPKH